MIMLPNRFSSGDDSEVCNKGFSDSAQGHVDHPQVDYFQARSEYTPFMDFSVLDPVDSSLHEETKSFISGMSDLVISNRLPTEHVASFKATVSKRKDIFRVGFSSSDPANVRPLKIELTSDARPILVKLRNYTQKSVLSWQIKCLIFYALKWRTRNRWQSRHEKLFWYQNQEHPSSDSPSISARLTSLLYSMSTSCPTSNRSSQGCPDRYITQRWSYHMGTGSPH